MFSNTIMNVPFQVELKNLGIRKEELDGLSSKPQ